MKTLKLNKAVAVIAVLTLTFTQIVPAGWAANTPAGELRARGVSASVDALANPAKAPSPAPAPQKAVGFVDSTVFQLNENPLSPATPELATRSDAQTSIEPLRDSSGIQLTGPTVPANGTLAPTPEPTTQTAGQLNIPEPPRALELTPVTPLAIDPSVPPASEDHGNTMTVTTTVTETQTETVTLPDGTVQYLDEQGRVIKEIKPDGSSTLYAYGEGYKTTIELDASGNPVSARRVFDDGRVEIYGHLERHVEVFSTGKNQVDLWSQGHGKDTLPVQITGILEKEIKPDGSSTLYAYGEGYKTTIELDASGNPVSARRVFDDGKVEIYGQLEKHVEVFFTCEKNCVDLWSQGHERDQLPIQITGIPEEVILPDGTHQFFREDPLQVYYKKLAELQQFMSGILLNGVTLDQISSMLLKLGDLKKILEKILAETGSLDKELRDLWAARWAEFDSMLATRPIIIHVGDVTVEFLLSDAKKILDEEYLRLGTPGTYDFARLPGVSSADLAGLQKLADYFASRQVGSPVSIPVFNMLSPIGYMTLLTRLVEKYGQDVIGADTDNDGYAEVNLAVFRRMVNGTELAYRQAMTTIHTIFLKYNITFPEGSNVSFETLSQLAGNLTAMSKEVKDQLLQLINQFSGEAAFKSQLMAEVQNKLNEMYRPYAENWSNALYSKNIVFTVPGIGQVTVSFQQLTDLTWDLPRGIAALLRYPGIRDGVGEALLRTLETAGIGDTRGGVCLSCADVSNPDVLSDFAVRIQFVSQFLGVYGSAIVSDGAVNSDMFRDKLLLNDHLRELLGNALQLINDAIARAHGIAGDVSQGITMQVYESLLVLIRETNASATDILRAALGDVIYSTRNEVTSRLQERFNQLLQEVDGIFAQAQVRIVINGRAILVDPKQIESLIQQLLPFVAVNMYGSGFNRGQYARLNGITEALLNQLRGSDEVNYYRTISFNGVVPVFSVNPYQMPDAHEIWFSLIPQVLEGFGQTILDAEGNLSLAKVREQFLAGVNVGVDTARFGSIVDAYRDILNRRIAWGRSEIEKLDFSKWEQRKLAEGILQEVLRQIQAESLPMIQLLNNDELSQLNSLANYGFWNQPAERLYDLWSLVDAKRNQNQVVTVTLPGGQRIRVDLGQVLAIPGFPSGVNYPRDLFPGLTAADLNGTERNSVRMLTLSKSGVSLPDPLVGDGLTAFGREQLVIQVVVRIHETLENIPELYRNALFTQEDGTAVLNTEVFRRLIKGVDLLHQQILQQTNAWIQAVLQRIRELMKGDMTIQTIKEIYAAITALRGQIVNYMDGLTVLHEKTDVIEMEEAVTGHFQVLFSEFFDYIRTHDLVWNYKGQRIVLPVNAIRERIMTYLQGRFPTDDIAAHHFVYLIGVTMQDVRGFDKLEEFLGNQIIALPRNSDYLEVISKLSEIGILDMIVTIVERFAKDVVETTTGVVNINQLMEFLTNQDLAAQRAQAEADRIASSALARLQAILEAGKLTPELLAEVFKLVKEARINLVNTLNDFVVSFDQEHFDQIQDHLNSVYASLMALKNRIVSEIPIEIKARGGLVFRVRLAEIAPVIAEQIELLLSQMPPVEPEPIDFPLRGYFENHIMIATELLRVDSVYFPEPAYEKYPIFDNNQTLSEYGFMALVVRLISKYGSFVADQGGNFSLDKFLYELNRSDEDRAREIFAALKASGLDRLRALIPADPNASVTLDQIAQIHALLDQLRNEHLDVLKFFSEEGPVGNLANASWSHIMGQYEAGLFSRSLHLVIRGRTVTVNVKTLIDIIFAEYDNGAGKFLQHYAEGGETQRAYYAYRTLVSPQYRPYYDGGYSDNVRETVAEGPYPFTLGDLARIPGISSKDLQGLDLFDGDSVALTFAADAIELLRGKFNLRVLAPGSGIQLIGAVGSLGAKSMSLASEAAYLDRIVFDGEVFYYDRYQFRPSNRDLMFRIIPAVLEEYFDVLFKDGAEVDLEAFRKIVRGETLPSKVQAFVDQLQNAVPSYKVTVERIDGTYRVTVAWKSTVCDQDGICAVSDPMPGALEKLSFVISGEGVPDISSLQAKYFIGNGTVNAQQLFDGINQILIAKNTVCNFETCFSRVITAQEVLAVMAELRITQMDQNGSIRFEWEGQPYEIESPGVQAVKASVRDGLLNTFGFTKAALDQLIKDGKIVITVDLEKLTATVTIDPSVQLPVGAVNLTDPLGNRGLPGEIHYQLGAIDVGPKYACGPDFCPPQVFQYYLVSGEFNIGNRYFVQMNYEGKTVGDSRLYSVKIYDGNPYLGLGQLCDGPDCPTGDLIKEITFEYLQDPDGPVVGILAHIVYSQGEVTSRDITLRKMEDGQYHIQTVTDKDATGNVIAKNEFHYETIYHPGYPVDCIPGQVCPPAIPPTVEVNLTITRTDANGKPLSEIVINNGSALITLPNGSSKEVTYASLEQLLALARQFEQETARQIAAVRASVQAGLLNTFGFTQAALDQWIKDGKIVITVDLEHLTATVTIDPSVTLPAGAVNLTDPLGNKGLPGEIHYQLGSFTMEMGVACSTDPAIGCPHASPTYFLKSGSFNIGTDYFVRMNYLEPADPSVDHPAGWQLVGDNRLHSVLIFDGDPTPVCTGELCATRLALKVISYEYSDDASVVRAHIVHNIQRRDGVASRDVALAKMEDGQYHIQTVVDKDATGNVIATSKFNYLVAGPDCIVTEDGSGGDNCSGTPVVTLESITRTKPIDGGEKLLSTITFLEGKTVITLSDGSTPTVPEYASLEDLLALARQFEQKIPLDPYLGSIASTFGVAVEDIESYKVLQYGNVCLGSGCPSWAIEVEAKILVNGELQTMTGWVMGPPWDLSTTIDPLQLKTLPPLTWENVTESSLEAETSAAPSLISFQNSPIRSSDLKKSKSKSALRSLASPKSGSPTALTAYQQATSLKASPVFGFEGSSLFGNILKELTR